MLGQPFDLLGHPISGEHLEGLDDADVKHAPQLLEHTAIGDLVREGMLEGVLVLREEVGFVEELSSLELRQTIMQRRLGQFGNGLEQGQGHLGADDGGRLEEALCLGGQAVDACCQHRLHRGGHLDGGQRVR
jgi:hypothetical protein